MNKIHILEDLLINKIAAGEVVERPMSVIKELIDNSIDAKSTIIDIYIYNGGLDKIIIIDNGEGMSKKDANMSFIRHATSKIKDNNDLLKISTLGFRGEAIPSIASISKTTLLTNNTQESTKITYDNGNKIKEEISPSNKGTTIIVEELFYKTPARLKHMKSPYYETSLITNTITKFALCYPNISFNYYNNDTLVFKTNGKNNIKDVVFALYGKEITEKGFEFNNKDDDFIISGFAIEPTYSKSNKNHIFIYINDRIIKDYKISKQIELAYNKYLENQRYPIIILKIKTDYQLVDVNISPNKTNVKISKYNKLLDLIQITISNALTKNNTINNFTYINKPQKNIINDYIKEADTLTTKTNNISNQTDLFELNNIKEQENKMNYIGQYDNKFLLATNHKGLYIFDQHASAERINYEYFLNLFYKNDKQKVALLTTLSLTLNFTTLSKIDHLIKLFKDLNIIIELIDETNIIIREIPLWLSQQNLNLKEFIGDMIDYFEHYDNINIDKTIIKKVATIACHHSIRFNEYLNNHSGSYIILELFKCKDPYHCPHGRPTCLLIDNNYITKGFKR